MLSRTVSNSDLEPLPFTTLISEGQHSDLEPMPITMLRSEGQHSDLEPLPLSTFISAGQHSDLEPVPLSTLRSESRHSDLELLPLAALISEGQHSDLEPLPLSALNTDGQSWQKAQRSSLLSILSTLIPQTESGNTSFQEHKDEDAMASHVPLLSNENRNKKSLKRRSSQLSFASAFDHIANEEHTVVSSSEGDCPESSNGSNAFWDLEIKYTSSGSLDTFNGTTGTLSPPDSPPPEVEQESQQASHPVHSNGIVTDLVQHNTATLSSCASISYTSIKDARRKKRRRKSSGDTSNHEGRCTP